MTALTRLRAHEMAVRLRQGEVSSRELAEAHLDAAERDGDFIVVPAILGGE